MAAANGANPRQSAVKSVDLMILGTQMKNSGRSVLNQFVVPATVMLSFVSFWRAAAIVLSDLGSSAYYVGAISEQAIGKAAPWFILAIMLFSYAVRAVYIESCSMFVRGEFTEWCARRWEERRRSFRSQL